ncbi:helix-turn-helix transcriptional regulator [Formosa algae]|uniref:DNA-binding transcriptional regulator AlpA n=1 Tax=Formosa algae TaxID=225843 RepID=A0A9X0YKK7_9FLAO|nr:helix-turn-helix domain-containing protein [Formosa algae]MBP1838641.1 putative DNA-binding transcriptional regulator AlpA [Formosa algae]MDQ0335141.1 putative DNA-binding transcriptional regulator AlpA [Formosa algae]OEI80392.1 excisionase [Formosa algae]
MNKVNIMQEIRDLKMMIMRGNHFQKQIFTKKNLMDYTSFSESTIHKLSSKNLIPHYKPTNGALFFDREEIVEWIREHKVYSDEEVLSKFSKQLKK